jgi:hypothetical protein
LEPKHVFVGFVWDSQDPSGPREEGGRIDQKREQARFCEFKQVPSSGLSRTEPEQRFDARVRVLNPRLLVDEDNRLGEFLEERDRP